MVEFLQRFTSRGENGRLASHERHKRTTICNERFRLNPLKLLPEEVGQRVGILQGEPIGIIYEGPDLACRQFGFTNVVVAKYAQLARRFKDIPFVVPAALTCPQFSEVTVFRQRDLGTVSDVILDVPTQVFLFVREKFWAAIERCYSNVFAC